MIATRPNEKKKTRSTTIRAGPVASAGLILGTILMIVEDLVDPYWAKPGLGSMTAYPPKVMTVVCTLMEAEARTYRKMVDHLRMNRSLAMKIGLPKIPSKCTIWRAYGMIPEPYLREVHTRIIGDVMVTGLLISAHPTGFPQVPCTNDGEVSVGAWRRFATRRRRRSGRLHSSQLEGWPWSCGPPGGGQPRGGICMSFPSMCRTAAPSLHWRFRIFLPPAVQGGSVGIHPAYSAYFGPFPPFQPALFSLGLFYIRALWKNITSGKF